MKIFSFAAGTAIAPAPAITITEWADTYRYLPQESTKAYGLYRSSMTPYLREIMDELSPQNSTNTIVFQKCTQIGATEIGNNLLFCVADLYPAPCLWVMPTNLMAEKHSKKKIAPSLKNMPCLKDKIQDAKSRSSKNTILAKMFPGGSWTFTGSNSPTSARSESIKVLILDDLDGFEAVVGEEGEPGDLFCKRTDSFGDARKIYKNSTPTVKNVSKIEREYLSSSQALYNVPCPECGAMFELSWGYLKFNKVKVEDKTTYMECPGCHAQIKEFQKTKMMLNGKWIHSDPDNRIRGFKINSLYSPIGMVSWVQIIEEFLAAQGSVEKLKVWTNTRMAETFEQQGDQPPWINIKVRAERYDPMTIAKGVKILTAGVDTHDDRLDIVIRGWGIEEESWLVFWGQLYGDPGNLEVWKELDMLIDYDYSDACGNKFKLSHVSIDSGGHRTMDVYNYCRRRYPIVVPIKGASSKTSQILSGVKKKDIDFKGQFIKNGVGLWTVGTEIAKATIYQRLKMDKPGRGYYHFYQGLPDEYFLQLTAEKLVTKYVDGFPRQKWIVTRPGGSNHALDAEVYCYHSALRAGIDRFSSNQRPKTVRKKGRRIISKGFQL